MDALLHAVDPVSFDIVGINSDHLFDSSTNLVTIAVTGYYYVYVSAATQQSQVSQLIQPLNVHKGQRLKVRLIHLYEYDLCRCTSLYRSNFMYRPLVHLVFHCVVLPNNSKTIFIV